jgi:ABC-type glycerol-3-phosphate transport system substrate-binding protein
MIFIPSWKLLDILKAKDTFNFEIGVAPVPQALPEKPVTWGSYWVNTVPASGKNTGQAWDFLNFLASEQQQLTTFNETSKFRVYGGPYSMVGLSSQLDSNPYLKPYVETAPFAKGGLFSGRAGNRKQVEALGKAVQTVLAGGDASKALKDAKEEMTK